MAQFETRPGRQTILYSLLGIVFGILSYISLALSSAVLLYPLMLALLYVKAGWLPVIFSVLTFGALHASMLGMPAMLLLALLTVAPAVATLMAAERGLPHFTQLKISVFSFGGCALAVLLILGVLTNGNLVDALVDMMDKSMRALPATVQDTVLTAYYPDLADKGAKAIPILGDAIRSKYWDSFFREMRESLLAQIIPSLLKSALTTAFLCSYLPARSLRLRGKTPEAAFVPLSRWALPGQVTVGITLTTLAAYLYDSVAATGSVGTFMTMFTIMECVFSVQGIAAWDRMMCAAKATYRRKAITAGAMYLLAPTFLSAIGLCSALFGRHGLLMKMKNTNPPE